MAKSKIEEGWNLMWEGILFFIVPSVELILIGAFTKIIYDLSGFGWAFLFFAVTIFAFIISIKQQVDKTMRFFNLK